MAPSPHGVRVFVLDADVRQLVRQAQLDAAMADQAARDARLSH